MLKTHLTGRNIEQDWALMEGIPPASGVKEEEIGRTEQIHTCKYISPFLYVQLDSDPLALWDLCGIDQPEAA